MWSHSYVVCALIFNASSIFFYTKCTWVMRGVAVSVKWIKILFSRYGSKRSGLFFLFICRYVFCLFFIFHFMKVIYCHQLRQGKYENDHNYFWYEKRHAKKCTRSILPHRQHCNCKHIWLLAVWFHSITVLGLVWQGRALEYVGSNPDGCRACGVFRIALKTVDPVCASIR